MQIDGYNCRRVTSHDKVGVVNGLIKPRRDVVKYDGRYCSWSSQVDNITINRKVFFGYM